MPREATKRRREANLEPACSSASARVVRGQGFTLVELVFVLAIVAIVAAIGMPRYGTALSRYRASLAAQRIAADLERAMSTANNRSTDITVEFRAATQDYVLYGVEDPDKGTPDTIVDLGGEPYRTKLVSVDFDGADTVRFDGYGAPDSGGTVIVESGGYQREVTLDEAGSVDVP